MSEQTFLLIGTIKLILAQFSSEQRILLRICCKFSMVNWINRSNRIFQVFIVLEGLLDSYGFFPPDIVWTSKDDGITAFLGWVMVRRMLPLVKISLESIRSAMWKRGINTTLETWRSCDDTPCITEVFVTPSQFISCIWERTVSCASQPSIDNSFLLFLTRLIITLRRLSRFFFTRKVNNSFNMISRAGVNLTFDVNRLELWRRNVR